MEDNRLVKDCLKGHAAAQRQLYERFASPMLAVCYRYTKSVSDAEDVLQEGFVKVFKNLHQYKGDGELGAWIRRIMVTTAINYLKKNSRYNSGYLKLSRLQYRLGKFLKSSTLSLIGRNLVSFDNYDGYDPETNAGGNSSVLRGIDFGNVPIPRTFQISFRTSL